MENQVNQQLNEIKNNFFFKFIINSFEKIINLIIFYIY